MGYFPAESFWSEPRVVLQTTEGRVALPLRWPEPGQTHAIGLIGGSTGDLTFLKQQVPDVVQFSDAYGKPGSLPDRPAGYDAFGALVFGEGAERMTDDEIQAIKTWVVAGGTIVLTGGASTQTLSDVRWKPFLPVGPVSVRNMGALRGIEKFGGSPPPPTTSSIAVGAPVVGAEVVFSVENVPIIVEKRFGLGKFVYIAFDPFQPPFKQWKGLNKLFVNGIGIRNSFINRDGIIGQNIDPYAVYPAVEDNPFDAELPGASIIFLILILHFVLAVPVNFAVLRKYGKGDLAWATTPIISIAFAAVFFALAAGLYKSGQSVRNRGVLIVSPEHNEGYYRGSAEMFIPRGGNYDAKLTGVDWVGSRPDEFYYYEGSGQNLELQDDGEIRMRSLSASNLSFHEFSFTQRVEAGRWLKGSIKRSGDGLTCSITNDSPYDLRDAIVIVGNKKFTLGDAARGAKIDTTVSGAPLSDPNRWDMGDSAMIKGVMTGFRPGPQIGLEVGSSIELLYVWGKIK
jgi:hypothetical protein